MKKEPHTLTYVAGWCCENALQIGRFIKDGWYYRGVMKNIIVRGET